MIFILEVVRFGRVELLPIFFFFSYFPANKLILFCRMVKSFSLFIAYASFYPLRFCRSAIFFKPWSMILEETFGSSSVIRVISEFNLLSSIVNLKLSDKIFEEESSKSLIVGS